MPAPAPDLTTLGVLLAISLGLLKITEVSLRALISKWKETKAEPDDDASGDVLEFIGEQSQTIAEQGLAQIEQGKLLEEVLELLSKMQPEMEDLHKWHMPEGEPGVKIWWNKKRLEKIIEETPENMAALEAYLSSMTSQLDTVVENTKHIKEDMTKILQRILFKNRDPRKPFDET